MDTVPLLSTTNAHYQDDDDEKVTDLKAIAELDAALTTFTDKDWPRVHKQPDPYRRENLLCWAICVFIGGGMLALGVYLVTVHKKPAVDWIPFGVAAFFLIPVVADLINRIPLKMSALAYALAQRNAHKKKNPTTRIHSVKDLETAASPFIGLDTDFTGMGSAESVAHAYIVHLRYCPHTRRCQAVEDALEQAQACFECYLTVLYDYECLIKGHALMAPFKPVVRYDMSKIQAQIVDYVRPLLSTYREAAVAALKLADAHAPVCRKQRAALVAILSNPCASTLSLTPLPEGGLHLPVLPVRNI